MTHPALQGAFRALALVALGGLPACDSITENIAQKAVEAAVEKTLEANSGGDVDIDTTEKSVTIKARNEKGENVVLQTQTDTLPDSWPKDIPAYPGAKISGSLMTGKGGMLMLETSDTPQQVIAFYRSKTTQMKQKSELALDNHTMVVFEDPGSKRGISVGASVQDGKTAVHLQVFENGG